MSQTSNQPASGQRGDIYSEITGKIISQIEAGILPWVQPWAGSSSLSIPKNATTRKSYSGVNILLLWDALFTRGFERNQWLTFKQALSIGGAVRKGEKGTTAVYADSFVPKRDQAAASGDDEPRRVAFLKRFTLFNIAQCDGLPDDLFPTIKPVSQADPVPGGRTPPCRERRGHPARRRAGILSYRRRFHSHPGANQFLCADQFLPHRAA
jgi:antirestriction protein ArdC